MTRPTLPKMPNRSPSAILEPSLPPAPTLSPSQTDSFNRAHGRLQRCLDELKLLDQQPGGGDLLRKELLREEVKQLTDTIAQLTRMLTVKLNVATEAELASMNRAQRRTYEATMRKNKKAKAKAKS
ncbi:MAG: hypothetical protein IPO67_03330 [Deltaproteobacteria bacterium]|nr:hypothetical protein [Deltaproteobacteria bacterium]MBK9644179.1 hypothetical protein [Deltaproteobacteria bacterium]